MEEIFTDIQKDIDRCDDVLKDRNHLEIVIAIEELADKYKSSIKNIDIENSNVWSYSKKDLEEIKSKLTLYKKQLINSNNKVIIDNMVKNLREEVNEGQKNYLVIKNMLDEIDMINQKDLEINEKWDLLKKHIISSTDLDVKFGTNIISVINLLLNN